MTNNLFIPLNGLKDFIEVDHESYENFLNEWETSNKPKDISTVINDVSHNLCVKYYGSCNETYILHNKTKDKAELVEGVDFEFKFDKLRPFQLEYLAYYVGADIDNAPSELIDIESKIIDFETFEELMSVRSSLLESDKISDATKFEIFN